MTALMAMKRPVPREATRMLPCGFFLVHISFSFLILSVIVVLPNAGLSDGDYVSVLLTIALTSLPTATTSDSPVSLLSTLNSTSPLNQRDCIPNHCHNLK